MDPRLKFLVSLRNLYNAGAIKTVKQAYDFARNQFGQLDDLFKRQIEQVFKKPIDKAPKPGEGGITSIKNAPKKETPSQAPGIMASEEASPLMQKLEKGADILREFKRPGMDLTTGMARTAARVILDNAGIKVPEKVDPLEAIAQEFGSDVLMDLRDVADELIEKERAGKITESMGEFLEKRGMFNLKRGRTDMPKGMSDEELEQIKKEVDQEKMLKDFDPTDRTENAMGGFQRTGFEDGTDPKKKKGVMSVVKKIPKLGKLVGGLETIMNKFGPDAIGTLEDFYKKGKLKTDPNVKKFQDDKKAVFDFNMRQLNKTEADANKEMDKIIKDQVEGGFIRDMEKSMQKDMQRDLRRGKFTAAEILLQRLKNTLKNEKDPYVQENFPTFIKEIEANPKLAEDPKVQEAFGLRDLPENQRLVEYDDGTFDFFTRGQRRGLGSAEALADELGIPLEEAVKIQMMEPDDQILEIERRRRLKNRKLNSQGGLQYLMGM